MKIHGRDIRDIIAEYRARASRRRMVDFQPRPKGPGEFIVRDRPVVPFEDRPRRSLKASWTRATNEALGDVAAAPTATTGWLTSLLQTGIQTWGAAKIEQIRQKSLVDTYGGNRTLQAMTALDYQRALEARQRGLELDRSLGVTSPMMTGATPWILGGVALLGVFLLARKK